MKPSNGRESVVTGLRIYTANNNPHADPAQYRISGRQMSGANVKHEETGLCWGVDSSMFLIGTYTCSSLDPSQKFYMNDIGEIRVISLPGYCLDHFFGFYYLSSKFISCFSDDSESNVYQIGKFDCVPVTLIL